MLYHLQPIANGNKASVSDNLSPVTLHMQCWYSVIVTVKEAVKEVGHESQILLYVPAQHTQLSML